MKKDSQKDYLDLPHDHESSFSLFHMNTMSQCVVVSIFLMAQVSLCHLLNGLPNFIGSDRTQNENLVHDGPVSSWDVEISHILSFGYLPTLVDVLWLKIVLNQLLFKDPEPAHFSGSSRSQLYYDLDLIVQLDPAFFEVYLNGANFLAVIQKDTEGARDLLNKGIHYFQSDQVGPLAAAARHYTEQLWRLNLLLAYIDLFDLKDMKSASLIFQEASRLPGAPEYLEQLAHRLERPGGEYEVGLRVLKFLSDSAADQKIKKELDDQRLRLYQGQFLFEVNLAFSEFVQTQPSALVVSSNLLSREDQEKQTLKLQGFWREFVRTTHTPKQDPWGGLLSLGRSGKVVSSTPYEPVFGLE